MNIVTDASGLIVMMSDSGSPTPPLGGALYTLTNVQRNDLVALAKQPNNGITFDGTTFTALPFTPPSSPDLSDADTLEKALKAVLLAAAAMSGKTPAQARNAFTTAWRAL